MVLNDIASAYVISGNHKEGIHQYKEALDRAAKMENMDDSLVAFNYNLGEVSFMTVFSVKRNLPIFFHIERNPAPLHAMTMDIGLIFE